MRNWSMILAFWKLLMTRSKKKLQPILFIIVFYVTLPSQGNSLGEKLTENWSARWTESRIKNSARIICCCRQRKLSKFCDRMIINLKLWHLQLNWTFRVEMKDVCTSETTETKHKSTSTSLLAVDSEIRLKMKDASTCITTETKNQSTSTSFFLLDSKIQGQMEDSMFSVSIEGRHHHQFGMFQSKPNARPSLK